MIKLQLKIFLEEKPEIWRRFIIPHNITFEKLHNLIQIVMGWENYHLHEFNINNLKIIPPDEGFLEKNEINPKKTKLNDFIKLKINEIKYLYDFGDSWEHIILIENILESDSDKKLIPVCIGGENACPPEDCGGIGGYEEILEIKKNKKHPQYKELIADWLGEKFDPKKFDINKINKRLQKC